MIGNIRLRDETLRSIAERTRIAMSENPTLLPKSLKVYHVFLASPDDMRQERKEVRAFFNKFNQNTAASWGVQFDVMDWENDVTAGVGNAQLRIMEETLERNRDSLALMIGLMGQRFGSQTGTHASGTEAEFEWALKSYRERRFPEIKWFFREITRFEVSSTDAKVIQEAVRQWEKVKEFQDKCKTVNAMFFKQFKSTQDFKEVLRDDLTQWLSDRRGRWMGTEPGNPTPTPVAPLGKSEQRRPRKPIHAKLDCFVITPMKQSDPRNAEVFERLIAPACEALNLTARTADDIAGGDRREVIRKYLSSAPMVVAYLGKPQPQWHPDVMLEVGFRVGTGKPLVLLSEEPRANIHGNIPTYQELLPFFLVPQTVVSVKKQVEDSLQKLSKEMEAAWNERPPKDWNATHPIIEVKFTNAHVDLIVTDVSPEAEALFGFKATDDPQEVKSIRTEFRAKMPEKQGEVFLEEQYDILGEIERYAKGLRVNDGPFSMPMAHVPVIFKDHPRAKNLKPVGYLPVIVRYSICNGLTQLRVIYLKVSKSLRKDPKGYWVCDL